jgi:hypothetical protein
MRSGVSTRITCFHTRAGFEKIVGRKSFTQEELQTIFQDNRADFEALASFLYDADEGEPVVLTAVSTTHAATDRG